MILTNCEGILLSVALAAAINQIKASSAQRMQLMPKTHNPYWRVHLEFIVEVSADGLVAKLLPKSECNVYPNLKFSADVLGEGGVQGLKDGLGEGILHLGGPATVSDAAVECEAPAGLGDGELDLDHGTPSEAQPVASAN